MSEKPTKSSLNAPRCVINLFVSNNLQVFDVLNALTKLSTRVVKENLDNVLIR